ncbi:MAG: universal stress protein [Methylococcales bacterium]|nr:universal stress protein [Methylococcales bacterium]MDD5631955.1 universal stress protein [Methylococcales bacterium]
MENYKHILLAVDFYENSETVTNKAADLAEKYQAKLSIVHVVDSLPITDAVYGTDIPFNMDLTAELMAGAKTRLVKLAERLGVPEDRLSLEMGSPKTEIIRIAEEKKVDLIVLGSHGRHGLGLLLGSTANGVLHHASCDVLAVRLQDN